MAEGRPTDEAGTSGSPALVSSREPSGALSDGDVKRIATEVVAMLRKEEPRKRDGTGMGRYITRYIQHTRIRPSISVLAMARGLAELRRPDGVVAESHAYPLLRVSTGGMCQWELALTRG